MKDPLHILHVEDNEDDVIFTDRRLKANGIPCAIRRVDCRDEFEAELEKGPVDLILCDFSMPKFDGLSALKIARQKRPDIPFIFLSGTIGEELAVEALREGATDYIIKDRASRLPSSIKRALRDAAQTTEARRMEERIREQAELLDRARDAICLKDMEQNILYWNKGAERLYGWASREAIGKNANELLFQDDLKPATEALPDLIRNGEWLGELHQVSKAGKRIIVESRWTLLRDSAGNPQSVLVINTDITEKKQIEAQFLRTQRLEGIGALAGGIAHDLNNALAPLLMGMELIRQEVGSDEGKRHLEMIDSSVRRAADMVRQILAFSRGVSGQDQPVKLEPIIEEMAHFAAKTFPHGIQIETRVAEGLPIVVGNPTQLHQVLLNLCVNARDAMPTGGVLAIGAEVVTLETADLPPDGGLKPGNYVRIKVSDTGHGIPAEIQQKIFEPFFTTKELGKGTGLGLSTVLGIVKTHNGFLDVGNEPDKGAAFKVYLPANKTRPDA
jgi:two-component system cell cycle sensor histidine kinase/response regulator CckA